MIYVYYTHAPPSGIGTPVASQVAQLEAYVHETLFTPEGGRRDEYLQVRGCRVLHNELYLLCTCPPSGIGAPVASQVVQLEAYGHETLFTPEGGRRDEYLQMHDDE